MSEEFQQLKCDVENLKSTMTEMSAQVSSLVTLWEQAQGIVVFVKWCAYIAGAIGGFIAFVSPYIKVKS